MVSEPGEPNNTSNPMASTTTAANSATLALLEVIHINSTTQLPLEPNSSNFPFWYLQFDTFLIGLDLIRFVNGTHPCLASTTTIKDTIVSNPGYSKWIRQDKLISITESVTPMIATSKTSYQAMTKPTNLFASKTKLRITSLKKKLSLYTQGDKSVVEYMQAMKSIADQLSLGQAPIAEDDLISSFSMDLGWSSEKFQQQ
ncbi:uncharacterized protein LOC111290191 [Durio zibethinus]|uniref:Uncharacterized protein LOC111290191 n=1 Tax=Durio zibethinus TaxID=66656 RepID=A0A6P5YB52_DURZI|nr:uncharacterized protein LOC111290191 [Durio zibethinus]